MRIFYGACILLILTYSALYIGRELPLSIIAASCMFKFLDKELNRKVDK